MKKYELILFDLDGTLCNTDEMVVQSYLKIYEDYEPKVRRSREELYYFSGPPVEETMAKEFPDYPTEMMCKIYREVSKDFYDSTVTAYEGEVEVLSALKQAGYLLGIVTNKANMMLRHSLKLCHIDNFFDVIISSNDVKKPKPSPEGIFKAMNILGIKNKEEVIYIGDNDLDYKTAENAGIDSMLVSWGPRKLKCLDEAKYQVKSYKEMGEILL